MARCGRFVLIVVVGGVFEIHAFIHSFILSFMQKKEKDLRTRLVRGVASICMYLLYV